MKIKLLNDGGYYGFDEVEFPVTVDAEFNCSHDFVPHYRVEVSVLRNLGYQGTDTVSSFLAWLPEEVEVIS